MSSARRSTAAMAVAALLGVPLAGLAASEEGPLSGRPGHGLVGSFIAQLKQEDDETEVRELAAHQPSQEEREQGRERLEQVRLEETQAAEEERLQREPS
jgi:hypothetical protein